MSALNALLNGLIDYAGLFPPAALDMPEAVRHYAECRQGPRSSMLGPFVVPVRRLGEFDGAFAALTRAERGRPTWRLSALVGEEVDAELAEAIRHETPGEQFASARIDSIEMKGVSAGGVARTSGLVPHGMMVAYEIPLGLGRAERWSILSAVRSAARMAKLRTGGLTPSAIPSPGQVAEFIWDCARARVPFKATAGLHHPVRGEHRLTYTTDSPSAVMHGFLNVFVGAAVAWSLAAEGGMARSPELPPDVLAIIDERDAACFTLRADRIRWRDIDVPLGAIERARADFARSFGSCSFDEPVSDLNALGWIP
jgi:hypothetical protein